MTRQTKDLGPKFCVQLNSADDRALRELAAESERPVAWWVRKLVAEGLAKYEGSSLDRA